MSDSRNGKFQVLPASPVPAGGVDLERLPCTGCRHRVGQACRRNPPQWTTPMPVVERGAIVGQTSGGWMFPPAAIKCGEFTKEDA